MKRKILSLVLCTALFSAALCTGVQATGMGEFQKQRTYDGRFSDISGKWHETFIADLYEYGLAEGMSDTEMAPDAPVTVAQVIALAARINAKYYSGTIGEPGGGAWYDPYISYARDYGLIDRNAEVEADRPATRGESALIFSRALPDWQFDAVNESGDFGDVAETDACFAAARLLCRAGVINGYEDGLFRPEGEISRAEAMTIADRTVNKSQRRGYDEAQQAGPGQGGNQGSDENQGSGLIGVGTGEGRATFLAQGVAMLTIDMKNSSFTLAVYADIKTGGMVTLAGVCEVKEDANGNVLLSCAVTDRAAQGGASVTVANQAEALEALGFTYDGNRTIKLTEAVVNKSSVLKGNIIGLLSIGASMTVAN